MRIAHHVVLLCAVACGSNAMAGSWADGLFDTRHHEFGTIPRGSDQRCSFVLLNSTPEPVRIAGLSRTCGCTQITLDDKVVLDQNTKAAREYKVIAPGQEARIGVVLDTRSFVGAKSAEIIVSFDQPSAADVRLTMHSFIRQDIVFNPGSVQLGSLARGQTVTKEVEIEYAGTAPWQILRVSNSNPHLDIHYDEMYRRSGQVGYRLTVNLKATAPSGIIREAVLVETNDTGAPQFPVLISGQIQADLIVTPTHLTMGTVKPGQGVTRQVLLRGKEPFQIVAVDGAVEDFQVEAPEGKQTFHKVIVRFTGSDSSGDRECTFKVRTDLADESAAEFKASVRVIR